MSRTRSDTLTRTDYGSFQWWNSSGVPSHGHDGTQNVSLPRSMTDEVTPGIFRLQREGKLQPVNPMSKTSKKILSDDTGEVTYDYYYGASKIGSYMYKGDIAAMCWYYASGYDFPPWVGSNPSWPLDSDVLTSALADARNQGFDVLTFLAEWGKTVELIKSFRTRVLKRADRITKNLKRDLREGSTKSGAYTQSAWDIFSDAWLEYRYGWRILQFDVESINEALYKLQAARSPFVRGYATQEDSVERTIQSYASPQSILRYNIRSHLCYAYGYATGSLVQRKTYKKRAGTILDAYVSDIFDIDPLVTTWEIIPFSFILDWFTNIGELATAYSPFATENLLDAWVSAEEILETTGTFTVASGSSGPNMYNLTSGTASFVRIHEESIYERYQATPSASLSFKLNLDAAKIADLSAIFFSGWAKTLKGVYKSTRI